MQIGNFQALLGLAAILSLGACAKVVVKDGPTISHIHIGHAITGFNDTPKKQGLLVMAEISSVAAATNNELLVEATRRGNSGDAKEFLREIALAVNPELFESNPDSAYGLQRAVAEAITHLDLAASTPDASQNVQRTVTRANIKARQIVRNIDELSAFLDAGLRSKNIDQLKVITEEVNALVLSIAGGPDSDASYGLFEFREDIEQMVDQEDPPYVTVESFYLFNLIKLPSGEWGFNSRQRRRGAGYRS